MKRCSELNKDNKTSSAYIVATAKKQRTVIVADKVFEIPSLINTCLKTLNLPPLKYPKD